MVPRSGVAKLQRFRVLARERQRHSKVRVIAGNSNELSYIIIPILPLYVAAVPGIYSSMT